MGRGQYDRAAARAKRDGTSQQFSQTNMANYANIGSQALNQQANDAAAMVSTWHASPVNPNGERVTQEHYDALVVERDKLLRLCKTHGLFV